MKGDGRRTELDASKCEQLQSALQPQLSRNHTFLVCRCHSPHQLTSSTNTRHVKTVYEAQFHIPEQPHASQTPQSLATIYYFDRDPVIIAKQTITQSHTIHSATCKEFSHPRHLVPTFCGELPRSRPERRRVEHYHWVYLNRRTVGRIPPVALV